MQCHGMYRRFLVPGFFLARMEHAVNHTWIKQCAGHRCSARSPEQVVMRKGVVIQERCGLPQVQL